MKFQNKPTKDGYDKTMSKAFLQLLISTPIKCEQVQGPY